MDSGPERFIKLCFGGFISIRVGPLPVPVKLIRANYLLILPKEPQNEHYG